MIVWGGCIHKRINFKLHALSIFILRALWEDSAVSWHRMLWSVTFPVLCFLFPAYPHRLVQSSVCTVLSHFPVQVSVPCHSPPKGYCFILIWYYTMNNLFFSRYEDSFATSIRQGVTVHSVHSNALRDAQKSCIRMISRRNSRVFCELCSQKTPRGTLPVNSNFLGAKVKIRFSCHTTFFTIALIAFPDSFYRLLFL